jgi:tetratricopeptide (TPR) repeat protein
MRKHLTSVCFSRLRVHRNILAIVLVLHCALWVAPGVAAEVEDASKAASLNRQVVELYQAGKYQQAIPIARQIVEISEKLNSPEHPDTAASLKNLGFLYLDLGKAGLVIASKDEPRWIPLGAAPAIEKNAELYRKSVRGDTDETTLPLVLRSLHDQVWAPIKNAARGRQDDHPESGRRTQFHFLCDTADPDR